MTDNEIQDLINEFKDQTEIYAQLWNSLHEKLYKLYDIQLSNSLRSRIISVLGQYHGDTNQLWEQLGSQLGSNLTRGLRND